MGETMTRAELSRLRREHGKAFRLWKATRKPRHWAAMRDIVTKIVALGAARVATSDSPPTQGGRG